MSNVAANKLVGNPASFRWGNVAAAAVTNAIGIGGDNTKIGSGSTNPINGIVNSGIRYSADRLFGNAASFNFRDVAIDAFGNALGNSIVSGLNKPPKLTDADKAKLDAFSQAATDISKAQSDKTGAMTDARIAELGKQTGNAVGAEAAAIAETLVKTTPVNYSVRDVSGINAFSAKIEGERVRLTQSHNEQMYSVQQTLLKDQWLLGGSSPTPVIYDPLTPTPYPLPDPTPLPSYERNATTSTTIGALATFAGSLDKANEAGARRKAINMVSKSLHQPVNGLRVNYLKDFRTPLVKTAQTYAPISNAKSLAVLEKFNGSAVGKANRALPWAYGAAQVGEELVFAHQQNLSGTETALNATTRAIGTAGELAIGHGVSHGVGLTTGTAAAVFFAPVAPVAFAVGYAGGYALTNLTYGLSGVGTSINNLITDGYRDIYNFVND